MKPLQRNHVRFLDPAHRLHLADECESLQVTALVNHADIESVTASFLSFE